MGLDHLRAEASSAEVAELEVRRAAAERQTSHMAARLKIEQASHAELQRDFDTLSRADAVKSEELSELRAENVALQSDLLAERARTRTLDETIESLRDQVSSLRESVARAETDKVISGSEHVKELASTAVIAEAARGRELASRLEHALKEAKEREAEAITRADVAAATASAEGERRARTLKLQLEQLREAAEARDKETSEAHMQQRLAEKTAASALEVQTKLTSRVAELEGRLDELRLVSAERDTLRVRSDELSKLVEAQGVELRRLQEGKAKAKAAAAALRRQLSSERQAHRTAAAHSAQQLRAQAEAAALAAEVKGRQARALLSGGIGGSGGSSGEYFMDAAARSPSCGGLMPDLPPIRSFAMASPYGRPQAGRPQADRAAAADDDLSSPDDDDDDDDGPKHGEYVAAMTRAAPLSAGGASRGSSSGSRRGAWSDVASPSIRLNNAMFATPTTAAAAAKEEQEMMEVEGGGDAASPSPSAKQLEAESVALAAKLKTDARSLSSLLLAGAQGYGDSDGLADFPKASPFTKHVQSMLEDQP